jgi:hypothetical protein
MTIPRIEGLPCLPRQDLFLDGHPARRRGKQKRDGGEWDGAGETR